MKCTRLVDVHGTVSPVDVAVVGLGGTGLAALLEAHRRGATVVGYDAGVVGSGATGRNAGFLVAGTADFYHRRRDRDLYGLTLEAMERIVSETPQVVSRIGCIRRAATPEEREDCEAHYQALVDDGFLAERRRRRRHPHTQRRVVPSAGSRPLVGRAGP